MSYTVNILYRNCKIFSNSRPVRWNVWSRKYPIHVISSSFEDYNNCKSMCRIKYDKYALEPIRKIGTNPDGGRDVQIEPPEKKPGLIQRFKQMYKDYWYVLVPVHLATSAVWLGTFYYTLKSGVDILSILQSIGVSESIMAPLKDSSAGYVALTYALYKIATPLRYAVTLGGTTYAIKKLTVVGWIKPVPSKERIKEMLQEKKDNIQDRFQESKLHYQAQMKEKHTQVVEEMKRYKSEMRNIKNKVKKM